MNGRHHYAEYDLHWTCLRRPEDTAIELSCAWLCPPRFGTVVGLSVDIGNKSLTNKNLSDYIKQVFSEVEKVGRRWSPIHTRLSLVLLFLQIILAEQIISYCPNRSNWHACLIEKQLLHYLERVPKFRGNWWFDNLREKRMVLAITVICAFYFRLSSHALTKQRIRRTWFLVAIGISWHSLIIIRDIGSKESKLVVWTDAGLDDQTALNMILTIIRTKKVAYVDKDTLISAIKTGVRMVAFTDDV